MDPSIKVMFWLIFYSFTRNLDQRRSNFSNWNGPWCSVCELHSQVKLFNFSVDQHELTVDRRSIFLILWVLGSEVRTPSGPCGTLGAARSSQQQMRGSAGCEMAEVIAPRPRGLHSQPCQFSNRAKGDWRQAHSYPHLPPSPIHTTTIITHLQGKDRLIRVPWLILFIVAHGVQKLVLYLCVFSFLPPDWDCFDTNTDIECTTNLYSGRQHSSGVLVRVKMLQKVWFIYFHTADVLSPSVSKLSLVSQGNETGCVRKPVNDC